MKYAESAQTSHVFQPPPNGVGCRLISKKAYGWELGKYDTFADLEISFNSWQKNF